MKTAVLIDELKKSLKFRGITYKALAEKIGLSEAAVKRLFSERNVSLHRLDQMCDAASIDVGDLFRAAEQGGGTPEALTAEAEAALADDADLCLALYLILLKRPRKTVLSELATDKAGFFKLCRQLEQLGLVEVHPGDHIVPRVSKSVRWAPNGPLSNKYSGAIYAEFLASRFVGEEEYQDFQLGALTKESFHIIKRKMAELFKTFEMLSELDAKSDDEKSEGFWLYSGVRPWAPLKVMKRVKGA